MATTVPPEGNLNAKICIIGEAPGEHEVQEQRPFVGAAGHLLNQMLMSAGILRCDCYLTNVVKERPEGNVIDKFIKFGTKKVYRTEAYDRYENQLYEELAQSSANVFVPLGKVALYVLTRNIDIMRRRGSILSCRRFHPDQPERKCVPTIHPAAALRDYLLRFPITHDFIRVKEESQEPTLNLPVRDLKIAPSFAEILCYLDLCLGDKEVGFDIETIACGNSYEVSCLAFSRTPFNAMCIPFAGEHGHYMNPDQEIEAWRKITEILENLAICKVGQNLSFDAAFLHNRYGICMKNMEDTMIAHAILFPDFPKRLDFITSIYTREPYYKDEGKKYFKLAGSLHDFWLYNAKDATTTLEAWGGLKRDLITQGNFETYNFQKSLIEPLVFLQEHGIAVNTGGLEYAKKDAEAECEKLKEELNQLAGYELNSASTKQLCDFFYNQRGFRAYVSRTTGNLTVDDDALARLERKDSKEASILRAIRKLQKLIGTYYSTPLAPSQRMCCSFNPVGTTTGRLSSSETIFGWGTNLQNTPPAMKRLLIPDEGFLAFNCDLAQAENRIVAYIAPEPRMIAAFEAGIDIHSQTSALIQGKKIEDISKEPGTHPIFPGNLKLCERDLGKQGNHALNYDMRKGQASILWGMKESEASIIIDAYHYAYPGIRSNYYPGIQRELKDNNRTLVNLYGRKRRFFDRWDDKLFKAAYAFKPQSTIGEKINRDFLTPVYSKPIFHDIQILNQVHDSGEFQAPIPRDFEEALTLAWKLIGIRDLMEQPIFYKEQMITIPSDCKFGLNLYDTIKLNWHQKAESLAAEILEKIPEARLKAKEKRPIPLDELNSLEGEQDVEKTS